MSRHRGRALALHFLLATPLIVVAAAGCGQGADTVDGGAVGAVPAPPPSAEYEVIRNWGTLPEGRTFGQVASIELDRDGRHLWVAERCGGTNCVGSDVPSVLRYDLEGNLVAAFGGGMFIRPHGIHVDRDGNVWVTDHQGPTARQLERDPSLRTRGHQVFKFSPTGEVLLTLGTAGEAGDPPTHLTAPGDVITAPNGDIFVAEGHSATGGVARISKFSADGTFIKSWGSHGSGPDQLSVPHGLAFDSQGRLYVADRGNNRIQVFDQEGNHLGELEQFGRPNDVFIDASDIIYALDSESGEPRNPGFRRGIYIGRINGEHISFIPPHQTSAPEGTVGEGITVDADGNIYVAEVSVRGLTKYVPR